MSTLAMWRKWPVYLVVFAIATLMALGVAGCASDGVDDDGTAQEGSDAAAAEADGGDDAAASDEAAETNTLALAFSDSDDETQNVIEHILADDASSMLQSYMTAFLEGRSTLSTIALVLPLGSYMESSAEDGTGAAVEIAYSDLSGIEEDAVQCALAYDAMALFCSTSLNTITVTIPDAGTYVFTREETESVLNLYGVTDSALTSDLFQTQDDWEAVRDALFQDNIYEVVIDVAME